MLSPYVGSGRLEERAAFGQRWVSTWPDMLTCSYARVPSGKEAHGAAWYRRCLVVTPRIHQDSRGSFLEWFRGDDFADDIGYRFGLAQANCSVSRRGVLRGIHFADVPPGQAKYVTCLSGEVLDVVVDLRVGSPGYGRWEAVRLDDQTRRVMFVSEGLGHGFMALSAEATVVYLCSTAYAPGLEHGVHPSTPLSASPGRATSSRSCQKRTRRHRRLTRHGAPACSHVTKTAWHTSLTSAAVNADFRSGI